MRRRNLCCRSYKGTTPAACSQTSGMSSIHDNDYVTYFLTGCYVRKCFRNLIQRIFPIYQGLKASFLDKIQDKPQSGRDVFRRDERDLLPAQQWSNECKEQILSPAR